MIYPSVTKEELNTNNEEDVEIASLPNRFVCRLAIDQEQTADLAQKMVQHVRQEMEKFCLEGFRRVFKHAGFHGTDYYAILMMDGDNMGSWFSEGKGRLDNETELAYHKRISRKLANFSKRTVPRSLRIIVAGWFMLAVTICLSLFL